MSHKLPKTGILSLIAALAAAGCSTPDYTKSKPSICEVHHVAMTKRAVPFAHGMIPMNRAMDTHGAWERRITFFPHPGDCEPGTDVVMPGEEGRVIVFVCPECERAKQRMEAR